jgi:cobalt-zinc-cadmium efflux system outer membrane protein
MNSPTPQVALCLLIFSVVSAIANDGLTRESAIRTAVLNNRELSVASLEIERAKSRLRWAGRLDNPELELSSSTDQFGLNEDEGTFEIAFSQRFPVTSRLRDEKIVRRHDVELAEIEFGVRQRQLAYEVDKAWIALKSAQRTEALQGEQLTLSNQITEFLEDRAKVGEVSSLDAAQASLNGQMLKQELGLAASKVADADARLRHLLGIDPDKAITVVGEIAFPKAAPPVTVDLPTALRNRPDYSALLVSSDLGRAQLSLAMAQRWDDIAVKVFAERERATDAPEGLERNSLVGIGISIPLPLRNRNEVAIESAKLDIEKARRARGAKVFEIHSELNKALLARKAAHDLVKSATEGALPMAKKNFENFRAAQQNGQASLLQVQQAQAQLLQLETSTLALRNSYLLLDAEVRFIAGTYPIPNRISVSK